MKKIIAPLISLFIFFGAYSQTAEEIKIRKPEDAQREAFLKKDTAALYKLMSPEFVVHAPTNRILTLNQLKHLIRTGEVHMESFERITEKVIFIENIAVAMGNETLNPTGKMPNAGKTVKRRYTDIWMKSNNGWQLVAKQATIISIT
jgi:ketosteroid isomerase-like protein